MSQPSLFNLIGSFDGHGNTSRQVSKQSQNDTSTYKCRLRTPDELICLYRQLCVTYDPSPSTHSLLFSTGHGPPFEMTLQHPTSHQDWRPLDLQLGQWLCCSFLETERACETELCDVIVGLYTLIMQQGCSSSEPLNPFRVNLTPTTCSL